MTREELIEKRYNIIKKIKTKRIGIKQVFKYEKEITKIEEELAKKESIN